MQIAMANDLTMHTVSFKFAIYSRALHAYICLVYSHSVQLSIVHATSLSMIMQAFDQLGLTQYHWVYMADAYRTLTELVPARDA